MLAAFSYDTCPDFPASTAISRSLTLYLLFLFLDFGATFTCKMKRKKSLATGLILYFTPFIWITFLNNDFSLDIASISLKFLRNNYNMLEAYGSVSQNLDLASG